MTATLANSIAARLCDDLVSEVALRHGREFIITTFRYPDGDSLNLYVEARGKETWVTDGGTTLYKFAVSGMRVTDARQHIIDVICRTYGLILGEDSRFSLQLDRKSPGESCRLFCEALTRVSTLRYDFLPRMQTALRTALESLLVERVRPVRRWTENWTDRLMDKKRLYPVDYRFNGVQPPRHVFRVATPYKAALVPAVVNFFRVNGQDVPTLSVIDPEANLGASHIQRVKSVSTEICFGIEEERIVDFALARAR
jgi:hypothetical protein